MKSVLVIKPVLLVSQKLKKPYIKNHIKHNKHLHANFLSNGFSLNISIPNAISLISTSPDPSSSNIQKSLLIRSSLDVIPNPIIVSPKFLRSKLFKLRSVNKSNILFWYFFNLSIISLRFSKIHLIVCHFSFCFAACVNLL